MRDSRSVGEKLAALNALRDQPRSSETQNALRQSLEDRSNRVIERAADLIGEAGDRTLVEDLLPAYRRLMMDPLKTDPGCIGKTAVVRTLVRCEYDEADVYREGIAYEQQEPVWGGRKDTAAELRGICALGLIRCVSGLEVLNCCAVLLVDPCAEARTGAARAIAALGQPEGAPLIRLKLLTGDSVPEVVGECCAAHLSLDRENGIPLAVRLLSSSNVDVSVQAALALGESRLPGVFEPLRRAWERQSDASVQESLLACIALLRSTEAHDFLVSLIDIKNVDSAVSAIKTLKVFGKLGNLRERTEAAVRTIGDARLESIFREEWGD